MTPPLLRRSPAAADGSFRAAAPVRIVHLGLGNFFRAHQAVYTDLAPDAADWGIAAFGGRAGPLPERLAAQDGLYTLVTRAATGDRFRVVASVARAFPGADHADWLRCLQARDLACVTVTVTEFGYRRAATGGLDLAAEAVQADIAALRADPRNPVTTAPARLVAGLDARRRAGAGPIAVLSCDNLPANGAVTRRVVIELAEQLDAALRDWIDAQISFPSSMVDRITPRPDRQLVDLVTEQTGVLDECPVVTEPFTEWVIAGSFPAGRPGWDEAGVTFAADVEPFERRKLRLLNGAHSLLAYAGLNRGLDTVADAITDDGCRAGVLRWWAEARLDLGISDEEVRTYCERLLERWSNRRIEHRLLQIAADGSQKLPVRILPVMRAQRAAGRLPAAGVEIIAAWVNYLRRTGSQVDDVARAEVLPLLAGPGLTVARDILAWLSGGDDQFADDRELIAALAAGLT